MVTAAVTPESRVLKALLEEHSDGFHALLTKYAATNPKLFGSVARGTAHAGSDIDILVEMDPADGNILMRASGLMEETRELFGREDIDVFPIQLLKTSIAQSVHRDAVSL
ncbi:nucleotidyltransferase family protein [Populibacterium corticicola]|uniref:Nucleotidyltransferase family protein n=1 Tax=Populibacterium corticicola TaxID=1812826 RepID=A0ABW5XCV9_9MICO